MSEEIKSVARDCLFKIAPMFGSSYSGAPAHASDVIEQAIQTQVEAERDRIIKIIECHHVDEECPDHELADCTYRIIDVIRTKPDKE